MTAVKAIQDGDILVTGSQDGTVCTWNVDNFTLLSTVTAGVPIHAMEVTEDNVFLITLQGENELHVRTFITGTHLHVLKRHKAKVSIFLYILLRPSAGHGFFYGVVIVKNGNSKRLKLLRRNQNLNLGLKSQYSSSNRNIGRASHQSFFATKRK